MNPALMMEAYHIAWILAALALAWAGVLFLAAEPAKSLLLTFPRSRIPSYIITALALAWSAWHFLEMPLESSFFKTLKDNVWMLGIIVYFLIIYFVGELLAVRALAGLLLLLGVPILDAIRWHDNPWRFLITLSVYAWAIKSLLLLLSPWKFRRWILYWFEHKGRLPFMRIAAIVYGIVMILAGYMLR